MFVDVKAIHRHSSDANCAINDPSVATVANACESATTDMLGEITLANNLRL